MLRFLQEMLDVVLPRKGRVARIDSYSLLDLQIAPEQHEAHGVEITTVLSYRTRAVEDLIRALKYDHSGHAARLLADILAEYLREEIEHNLVAKLNEWIYSRERNNGKSWFNGGDPDTIVRDFVKQQHAYTVTTTPL